MQSGFEEANSAYMSDSRKLIGQVRRFGDAGPAYEIVDLCDAGQNGRRSHLLGQERELRDPELTLGEFGFERAQAKDDDLASLFGALLALRALGWFGRSVSNSRAFRMDRGFGLTAIVKAQQR